MKKPGVYAVGLLFLQVFLLSTVMPMHGVEPANFHVIVSDQATPPAPHFATPESAPVFPSDQELYVHWYDMPTASPGDDWITVVASARSETEWGNWWYTSRSPSGSRNIGRLRPGTYEVRVYYNWPGGQYKVRSRLLFTVEQGDDGPEKDQNDSGQNIWDWKG